VNTRGDSVEFLNKFPIPPRVIRSKAFPVTGTIEQIYRQHRDGLYTLALAITRCPARAEDAVHNAIVRLCARRGKPTGDAVAYVFAAVRNAAIDQLRRGGPRSVDPVSIFDVTDPTAAPPADAERVESDRMIADAVDTLDHDQREAVVMHLYAGLTFQQIAEALGEPLQTIASRYRRGLANLRPRLEPLMDQTPKAADPL
jgi:RNA polymerase sigma-70 factor, ECF subfamily